MMDVRSSTCCCSLPLCFSHTAAPGTIGVTAMTYFWWFMSIVIQDEIVAKPSPLGAHLFDQNTEPQGILSNAFLSKGPMLKE